MTASFYDLAKNIARIILEHSCEGNNVMDVLLYGSTLTNPNPRDIDLLVLHYMGVYLENYSRSRSVVGEDQGIHYHPSTVVLHLLGYKEGKSEENSVFRRVCRLFDSEGIIEWDGSYHPEKINEILDIHMLDTCLFLEPSDFDSCRALYFSQRIPEWRQEAIKLSGKDPFYYHRILSSGRLFDLEKNDFTIPFEAKYSGKLKIFPDPENII